MRQSATYQAILKEGHISEAQRLLLLQGELRFGPPDETIRGAVEAIWDLDRLEHLSRRVVDTNVHDWKKRLSTP